MRYFLKIVVLMLLSVGLAWLLIHDKNRVYILISEIELIEIRLAAAVLLLLMIYFLINISSRFVMRLLNMSDHLQNWQTVRRSTIANDSQQKALLELSRGHWRIAEREFVKHVKYSDAPMLGYLNAARAAQHQSAIERRDRYLQLAHESDSQEELSIGITQAELYIAHQQLEQALAILTSLQQEEPKNTHILSMLLLLYKDLRDWPKLSKLIPLLRKQNVLAASELVSLEREVYTNLLNTNAEAVASIIEIWAGMPKLLKDDVSLISLYAKKLIEQKKDDLAEPLLRSFLKKYWDENVVYLYSLVEVGSVTSQLATIERLTEDHGKNSVLLLSLGKVCMRNQLWGKARIYLESSIGAGPSTEAYQTLGGLLENMGDQEGALECYRKGMSLALSFSE